MWSFSLFEEEDLINLLQRGFLEEELVSLVKQWEYLSPAVQFALIKHLRSVPFEEHVLAKALGVRRTTAKALLEKDAVEFEFPGVSVEHGKMIRGIAIRDTSEVFCNLKDHKRHITPLVEYLRHKGVISGSLGVVFDSAFVGNSFGLSLTLSFLVKRLPPDLCWSGAVRKDGRLVKVDAIDKKSQVCQKVGKVLAMPFHLQRLEDLAQWLDASFVDIPIAVSKDPIRVEEFFERMENLQNLRHIHRIDPSSLVIQTGRLEGALWQETARKFSRLVKGLDYTLGRRLRAHVVINGPISLAFALGILYGHTRPSVIYHHNNSERRYFPIELQNTREVKEHVEEYRFINFDLKEGGPELAVVLFLAHHHLVADVESFLKNQGIAADILVLTSKSARGNLDPWDFKLIAKECASAIQSVKGKKAYERVHFFFSCPVAIAYLLGVAFGHFDSGDIWNWSKERVYQKVLDLEFLRNLVEEEAETPPRD